MDIQSDDILQFYAYSADKPAGKGVGDVVRNPEDYSDLNKIKHWRRMFSSLWEEEFTYQGYTYLSFEHCLQACKFKLTGHDDIAYKFTVESNCNLNPTKSRRIVMLSEKELELWYTKKSAIKEKIYLSKYNRDSTVYKALLLTKDAQLINSGPRIKKIRCTRLEKLRTSLREKQQSYSLSDDEECYNNMTDTEKQRREDNANYYADQR